MDKKILLTALAGAAAIAAVRAADPQKPNIIIILTDDMGVGDLSYLNDGWVSTPNISRLAAAGLTVKNYYSAAPVSSPSRVGMTTGMYPTHWGINTFLQARKGNLEAHQFNYLDPQAPTMARALKGAGYATGHFGKWHMGGGRDVKDAPQIPAYGFDEYVSTWESPDPDPAITADQKWIWSPQDSVRRWDRTAYFVDKTLDFLRRHKGEPCFVNLWPDDVHTPWVPGEDVETKKDTWQSPKNLKGVLAEYDRQIGRLVDGLRAQGIDRNTIIIFTSDNGPSPTFNQQRANGLRGGKCSLYEGGIRMPFIFCWPARIGGGRDERSLMFAEDLFPSLCAIAGVKIPEGLDGEDRSGVLLGKPSERRSDMIWEFGRWTNFPTSGDYHRSPHMAIRSGKWKLLKNSFNDTVELYDMSVDEKETTNAASNNPEIVKQLSARLDKFWEARKEPQRK